MKILSAAFITALLVFTLATGWVEFVQPRLDALAFGSSPQKTPLAAAVNKRSRSKVDSDEGVDPSDESDLIVKSKSKAGKLRNESALNDITKQQLLAQFEDVKKREAKLAEREDTLNAICAEIRRNLAEMDDIRRRSAKELEMAERTVREVAASPTSAARTTNTAESTFRSAEKGKSTPDSRIANVLQELAARGNDNDAAALLSGFKERDIAKILGSMWISNPTLAMRLSEKIPSASAKMQASRKDSDPK